MEPARLSLAAFQQEVAAPDCLDKCLGEVKSKRVPDTSKPYDFDRERDELVNAIVALFKASLRSPPSAAEEQALKDLLIKKANKDASAPRKFNRLKHFLTKMKNGTLPNATDKEELSRLKQERTKLIADSNAYLHLAMPQLLAATDQEQLKKEMGPAATKTFEKYLIPFEFDKCPDTKAEFLQSTQLLSNPKMLVKLEPVIKSTNKPEAKNFFKNMGDFLAELSPYYNALWVIEDQIRQKRKESASGQHPISVAICNVLLEAGGCPTHLKALPPPSNPIVIPTFTRLAPAAGKGAPPPSSPNHARDILYRGQSHSNHAKFVNDLKTLRANCQSWFDNLKLQKTPIGYDFLKKQYVKNPPSGSDEELPKTELQVTEFLRNVVSAERNNLVELIVEGLVQDTLINPAERLKVSQFFQKAMEEPNPKINAIETERFKQILDNFENKKIPSDAILGAIKQINDKIDKTIFEANEFLKKAIPNLKEATDLVAVQGQMDPSLWSHFDGFLKETTLAKPLKRTVILQAVMHVARSYRRIEQELQKQQTDASYIQKAELKNFYANFGRFLEQFSFYYRALQQDKNSIRKIKNEPPPLLPFLRTELCNAFLEAGGATKIKAFPLVAKQPVYTKLPPKPPQPAEKAPPPPAPAAQPPETKPEAKENQFITIILWPYRQIRSLLNKIWAMLFG